MRHLPVSRFGIATALAVVASLALPSIASASESSPTSGGAGPIHRVEQLATRRLEPRTHFRMQPDGSSGAAGRRRRDPQHRLGQVDDPHLLRRRLDRDRQQGGLALHLGAGCHPRQGRGRLGPPVRAGEAGRREPRHRVRRRRHDVVDLRHGGPRHALRLRPGVAERVGPGRALPGDARHGRLRAGRRGRRLRRVRPHRSQRRPEGGHARQPRQGGLHGLRRRELLHEVRHRHARCPATSPARR